jgi:hypothetical protein
MVDHVTADSQERVARHLERGEMWRHEKGGWVGGADGGEDVHERRGDRFAIGRMRRYVPEHPSQEVRLPHHQSL